MERGRPRVPAQALVVGGALSVQFGGALATKLFARVGPPGALSLRVAFGAAALAGWYLVRGQRTRRGWGVWHRTDLWVAAAFGVVLAAMNLSFYEAIARIPLGVAVTVEFVGPLVLTLAGSRRSLDVLWALLAAGGVVLLAGPVGHHLDLVGLGLALLAGVCWAAYILLSGEAGRRFPEASGLALALVVASFLVVPLGLAHAGGRLFEPAVLGIGAVVAMSSALTYILELAALRRLSSRAFGLLTSTDPAFGALAGFLALGQHLSPVEVSALVLVMFANAGSTLTDWSSMPTSGSEVVSPKRTEANRGRRRVRAGR